MNEPVQEAKVELTVDTLKGLVIRENRGGHAFDAMCHNIELLVRGRDQDREFVAQAGKKVEELQAKLAAGMCSPFCPATRMVLKKNLEEMTRQRDELRQYTTKLEDEEKNFPRILVALMNERNKAWDERDCLAKIRDEQREEIAALLKDRDQLRGDLLRARLAASSTWWPIETAPKNGKQLVLWLNDHQVAVIAWWHAEKNLWHEARTGKIIYTPTHWALLAEPPK